MTISRLPAAIVQVLAFEVYSMTNNNSGHGFRFDDYSQKIAQGLDSVVSSQGQGRVSFSTIRAIEYHQLNTSTLDYLVSMRQQDASWIEFWKLDRPAGEQYHKVIESFLRGYEENVLPEDQDDIAELVWFLRTRVWQSNGSGGALVAKGDRILVEKYSALRNRQKKQKRLQIETRLGLQQDRQMQLVSMQLTSCIRAMVKHTEISQARKSEIAKVAPVIESILKRVMNSPKLKVSPYGSSATSLATMDSDLDLCIHNCGQLNIHGVANTLKNHGYVVQQVITNTLVPIIELYDPKSKVEVDICINRSLGIYNSALIETYLGIDSRVREVIFAVKYIMKQRGLINGPKGYLNSYTVCWMVIVFLQSISKPFTLLPRLQSKRSNKMITVFHVEGHDPDTSYDVSYCTQIEIFRRAAAEVDTPTSEYVTRFFRWFGQRHSYEDRYLDCRSGKFKLKPASSELGRALVVYDPFIGERNLAKNLRGAKLEETINGFKSIFAALFKGDFALACRG